MIRPVLIGAACALIGGATVASAQTAHILGRDGTQVKLDVMCHRAVVAPVTSIDQGLNITAQQVKCLIRRPDPFARCVRKANLSVVETADHGRGRPGDEIGAADALAAVQKCASAHL